MHQRFLLDTMSNSRHAGHPVPRFPRTNWAYAGTFAQLYTAYLTWLNMYKFDPEAAILLFSLLISPHRLIEVAWFQILYAVHICREDDVSGILQYKLTWQIRRFVIYHAGSQTYRTPLITEIAPLATKATASQWSSHGRVILSPNTTGASNARPGLTKSEPNL